MSKRIENKTSLGYLGVEFQMKLVKCFIEDGQFFVGLQHIVDQNMFTEDSLRRIVGFMKDRYAFTEIAPTYFDIEVMIRSKISDSTSVEIILSTLETIKEMDLQGMDLVESETEKFFKQQNLTKALNQAADIIKQGNAADYYAIEDIVKKALETNTKRENGFHIFDNIEGDLREDYRQPIPTGVVELDKSLYGGLGRGELGLVVAPMGVGKAQPLNAHILTPDGFKTMGDMFVGCEVLGADGQPYKVTGVYPQGIRPVYKISFSNETVCECDIDHLWTVECYSMESTTTTETLSLREIIDRLKTNRHLKFKLPFYGVMNFNEREVEIDPYIFGLNFGKNKPSVDILKDYVYNTVEIRREFLHGLIHAGIVKCNVKIDYITDYEISNIDNDTAELLKVMLKSLGNVAKIVKNNNQVKVIWKNKSYKESVFITNIEYMREDETQCIMIDSNDHLYITEDFIVTHNTSIMTGFAAGAATTQNEANNGQGYKVLHFFFEDDEVNIRRKYFGYILNRDACTLSEPSVRPYVIEELNSEELRIKRNLIQTNIIAKRLTTGEVTASQIKEEIKSNIAKGFKPDLVIVDYFECLKPERGCSMGDSEWTKEGITMRKLESICSDLHIALWVPVQGTKGSIGIEIVGLQHAGGSVTKTQIGHIVLTLARTDDMKSKGQLNLFIQKLRAVAIGRDKFINVKFNNGTCRFDMSNLEDGVDETFEQQMTVTQVANDVKRSYTKRLG